jgi:hypothetical protein
MATSKFAEGQRASCTASILVFSGRTDPAWEVPSKTAEALIALWQEMNEVNVSVPIPSLGYRGCALSCGALGHWTAYGGNVSNGKQQREDAKRRFEQSILHSAPAGLLPGSLLQDILKTMS